jgi:DNA-binding NarL/FixJ family response regulator
MVNAGGPPDPKSSPGQAVHGKFQSRRVAIVEDELLVAWTLEALLEDAGHEVIGIFSNGEDALAGLAGQNPDIVCMDINLGKGLDGIQTASQLGAEQPPRIIFITAYADPATAKRAREAVPSSILLGKPVSPDALQEAIERSGFSTN